MHGGVEYDADRLKEYRTGQLRLSRWRKVCTRWRGARCSHSLTACGRPAPAGK